MMTQLTNFSIGTELEDLSIWHAHVNDAIAAASSIGAIFGVTARMLHFAFWLANQKAILARKEFKKILSVLGWSGEEKIYLKIAAAFADYAPHELAQIEPRTIFQLAGNLKKYQSVIDKFHTLAAITQDNVRSLIASTRQSKASNLQSQSQPQPQSQSQSQSQSQPQSQPQQSVWHYAADGGRVCQIMIYDEKTGVLIERMAHCEARSFQYIIADAMQLRQAYIDGRLQWVEEAQPDVAPTENQEALIKDEDILEEPVDWSDCEYEVEGTWTFEVEEKDDDMEDEEAFAPEIFNGSDFETVDLLIEKLQTAQSWQEVSAALKSYEEYKQQAWEALTPLERRRIISITPMEVKMLSQAKRNGKIIDFQELCEDVYKVQYSEYIFGEIVYKSRINDFLARL